MPLIVNEYGSKEASGEGFESWVDRPVMARHRLAQGFQRIRGRLESLRDEFTGCG